MTVPGVTGQRNNSLRPRTRLTTPGGEEPEAYVRRTAGAEELYSPGFALPIEPRIPARWPLVAAVVTATLILAALIYLLLSVVSVDEQDPSLGRIPSEAAVEDS